jgi:hypothetical protein
VYSKEEAGLIALEYFEKSFEHFKELNHLAGMSIAREAAARCAD